MPDAPDPDINSQGKMEEFAESVKQAKLLDEVFSDFAEFSKPFDGNTKSSSSSAKMPTGGLDEQDLDGLRNLTKLILSDSKETEKQIFGVLGTEDGSITKMVGQWLQQFPHNSLKEPVEGLLEGLKTWEKTRTKITGDKEIENVKKLIGAFSALLNWVDKKGTETKVDPEEDEELQGILKTLESCEEPPTEATDSMLFNYLESLIGDDSDTEDGFKIPEADYEGADQLIDDLLNPSEN